MTNRMNILKNTLKRIAEFSVRRNSELKGIKFTVNGNAISQLLDINGEEYVITFNALLQTVQMLLWRVYRSR